MIRAATENNPTRTPSGRARKAPAVKAGHSANAEPADLAAKEVAALFLDVVPSAMRELRRQVCPKGEIKSRTLGLSLPQLRILACLADSPAGIKAVAEGLGVSLPAVSRMLTLLEKKGYVQRIPGQRDKREVEARLTAKGEQCFAQMQKEARAKLSESLRSVPAADLAPFARGLTELRRLLTTLSASR